MYLWYLIDYIIGCLSCCGALLLALAFHMVASRDAGRESQSGPGAIRSAVGCQSSIPVVHAAPSSNGYVLNGENHGVPVFPAGRADNRPESIQSIGVAPKLNHEVGARRDGAGASHPSHLAIVAAYVWL